MDEKVGQQHQNHTSNKDEHDFDAVARTSCWSLRPKFISDFSFLAYRPFFWC